MNKIVLVLAMAVTVSFGQIQENWNGWGDTARVVGFCADSTKYTKWLKLSAFENAIYSAYCRDTSAAGFGSDSIAFRWGVQTGHPSWTTTRASSASMELSPKAVIDTFTALTAGNFVLPTYSVDADGLYSASKGFIDSLNISGWAYQSRPFSPQWDVYIRFWANGITGNKKSKKLDLVFQVARRLVQKSGN